MQLLTRGLMIVGLLALLAAVGAYLFVRHRVSSEREAQQAKMREGFEKHHAAFVEDQLLLASLPALELPVGEGDAGEALNPRLPWDEDDAAVKAWRATLTRELPALALDDSLRDRLAGEGWLEVEPDAWEGLDFEWMASLADYAYWDVERDSPLAHADSLAFYEVPLPNFMDILAWAKLRLRAGAAGDDVLAAVIEVRHLSRLLLSTELLLGQMVGLALVGFENDLRLHLDETGVDYPEEWETVPEEDRLRMRRALFAAMAYAHLDTPPEHQNDIAAVKVGFCSALQESGWWALISRPLLGESRREDFGRLNRLITGSSGRCRLTRLRAAWTSTGPEADVADFCEVAAAAETPAGGFCRWSSVAKWVPGMRSLVGELLASIAAPDWWARYESDGS